MTDLDWSPELLIACHDEDEQNARLARHIWEDNGLDVPESFLDHLLEYLGMFQSYMVLVSHTVQDTKMCMCDQVWRMPL